MRRLFTFGCSYTSYSWPGWADLLSLDFPVFENWGIAGVGNRAIAERVTECNLKNNFGPEDIVIIQWSTHLRNDFFHQTGSLTNRWPGWKTGGSVFNYINEPLYSKEWLETFFDEEAYFMHTLHHISMIQNLLENTGVTWYMTSIGDLRELGTDLEQYPQYGEISLFKTIMNRFKKNNKKLAYKVTPDLEIYDKQIWGKYQDHWLEPIWPYLINNYKDKIYYEFIDEYGEVWVDRHPRSECYEFWLRNNLAPKLELDLTSDKYDIIVKRVSEIHSTIKNNDKRSFEKALFQEEFRLPKWPNMIRGFYRFDSDKREIE